MTLKCNVITGITKPFVKSKNLENNVLSRHFEVIKGPPYNCPKCCSRFKKLESLKLHCKHIHKLLLPSQRNFLKSSLNVSCSICSTTFANITGLKNHCRMRHKSSYVDISCSEDFRSEITLNIQQNLCHPNEQYSISLSDENSDSDKPTINEESNQCDENDGILLCFKY